MSAKNLQDSTNAGRKPWKTPVLLSLRAGAGEPFVVDLGRAVDSTRDQHMGAVERVVGRILAMLPSREAYQFWHDGAGSSLVALGSVAAAILPILVCVERDACRLSPRT